MQHCHKQHFLIVTPKLLNQHMLYTHTYTYVRIFIVYVLYDYAQNELSMHVIYL